MPHTTSKISPTAYATGQFWVRQGLSDPRLSTPQGRRLDRLFNTFLRSIGGQSFNTLLLARHVGIDRLLERAIEQGRVHTVIELAAGLSGRGLRLVRRYGEQIRYIETDLPHMIATKRDLLEADQRLPPNHRLRAVDVLQDSGPLSLAALTEKLDSAQGVAIISEGLMNYLNPEQAMHVWTNIAHTLSRFDNGTYLADAYLLDAQNSLAAKLIGTALSVFVQGRIHIHFACESAGLALMQRAGFADAALHTPQSLVASAPTPKKRKDRDRVVLLEARTRQR